ncbi:hypothetical protein C8F04DRAFT_7686 [Mycena alexandri]|uniref:Uncharacterized protein n=1 Tax=Mycena alexandri TaxID=1745969 RepID=A0AAD6TKU7_9AGAR|nr:hypothetical protein C8F04DRAFT_7686 [Mycena alexandri]
MLRLIDHFFNAACSYSRVSKEFIYITADLTRPITSSVSVPLVQIHESQAFKKRRHSGGGYTPPQLGVSDEHLLALDQAVSACPESVSDYCTPGTWLKLPFPFIYPTLPSDRFSFFTAGTSTAMLMFEFMPREFLQEVHQRFETLGPGETLLYLHGPFGLGKSHLLAALAILLRRQGNHVVFLPDCGALVHSPVRYVKSALLCTFSSDTDKIIREEIRSLESVEAIQAWCESAPTLCFVIDQLNFLKTGDGKGDRDQDKEVARRFVFALCVGHISIRSSSANDPEQFNRIRPNELLIYRNGMTLREEDSWFEHNRERVPAMADEDRTFFRDFTGGIPFFFTPLLHHSSKAFHDIWPSLSSHKIYQAVRSDIRQFAARIQNNSEEKRAYLDGVGACLTGRSLRNIERRLVDHRFCFQINDIGSTTCGIARGELFDILRAQCQGVSLSVDWLASFLNETEDGGLDRR